MYQRLYGRRDAQVGRKLNPSWDGEIARGGSSFSAAARHEARQTLRRSAGAGGADVRARQAPGIAVARRARRQSRSARPPGVPPVGDRCVVETGMAVILSSHIVADLERVCDYLVILSRRGCSCPGPIDELLAPTGWSPARAQTPPTVARLHNVIRASHTERQRRLLVRARTPLRRELGAARGRPRRDRARLSRNNRRNAQPRLRGEVVRS